MRGAGLQQLEVVDALGVAAPIAPDQSSTTDRQSNQQAEQIVPGNATNRPALAALHHNMSNACCCHCAPQGRQCMLSRWAHHQVWCCCAASDATPPSRCPSSLGYGSCRIRPQTRTARTCMSLSTLHCTPGTHEQVHTSTDCSACSNTVRCDGISRPCVTFTPVHDV